MDKLLLPTRKTYLKVRRISSDTDYDIYIIPTMIYLA